jgi:hypothetical protein
MNIIENFNDGLIKGLEKKLDVTKKAIDSSIDQTASNLQNSLTSVLGPDGKPVKCKGVFWAKKGIEYHLGDTITLASVVVTWGIDNQACTAAQSITNEGKQLYPYGLNIFEFSVNTWWQNGKVTGAGESFDISCVDGLHSVLRESVTINDGIPTIDMYLHRQG